MPNSLIFCIPVKNCIINRTATLDRPQGLEPQNHFDPSLPCLPPKGRTSNFLASRSLSLQCLNSLKLPHFHQLCSPRASLKDAVLCSEAPSCPQPTQQGHLPVSTQRAGAGGSTEGQPPDETWAAAPAVVRCSPFPSPARGRTTAAGAADAFSHPCGRAIGFAQWQLDCSQEPSPNPGWACFL